MPAAYQFCCGGDWGIAASDIDMPTTQIDRESLARWYATEHLKTDPGVQSVYYLPSGAGEREIRFIEVNTLIAEQTDDALEPIDFGIDIGTENAHKLYVLDVTESQWSRMRSGNLALPPGWSLAGGIPYAR